MDTHLTMLRCRVSLVPLKLTLGWKSISQTLLESRIRYLFRTYLKGMNPSVRLMVRLMQRSSEERKRNEPRAITRACLVTSCLIISVTIFAGGTRRNTALTYRVFFLWLWMGFPRRRAEGAPMTRGWTRFCSFFDFSGDITALTTIDVYKYFNCN